MDDFWPDCVALSWHTLYINEYNYKDSIVVINIEISKVNEHIYEIADR